jgi:hypothetical protein
VVTFQNRYSVTRTYAGNNNNDIVENNVLLSYSHLTLLALAILQDLGAEFEHVNAEKLPLHDDLLSLYFID